MTFTPPAVLQASLNLPCNASGQIENWPAFWLYTATGGTNEIDIVEGLGGVAKWHYHYTDAAGAAKQVGGAPAGSYCGLHTYRVDWQPSSVTFYYDGVQVGQVAESCAAPCISIGVPVATNAMHLHFDYAASSAHGGPTTPGVSMHIRNYGNIRP